MQRFFILMFFAIFLASCKTPTGSDNEEVSDVTTIEVTSPTIDTPTVTIPTVTTETVGIQTSDGIRYVKNSLWQNCSLDLLTAKKAGRAAEATISASDLDAIVQTLNDSTNDTQYFVEKTDIDITESPSCNVYIAKNVGHEVVKSILDFPRSLLAERIEDFNFDARACGACTVYIDKVPPYVAPPEDTRTRHEKYHLQMINKYGKIVVYNGYRYEESCEETYDAFAGEPEGDGPTRGWPTVDDYFNCRINAFQTDMMSVGLVPEDKPWTIISGSIWVEPVPETPASSD